MSSSLRARNARLIPAVWLLVLGLGAIPPLLRESNTDMAWHHYLAGQLLSGERQGVDFIEVNPPLTIWLAVPSLVVSRMVGARPWIVFVLLTVIGGIIVLGLAAAILRRLVDSEGERTGLLLMAGYAALVMPRLDFSEREHLALLLTLPFVLLGAVRAARLTVPRGLALAAGVLGGVGFSLKPHFIVAWTLLEMLLLVRLRRKTFARPELAALVIFGAAYGMVVWLLVPDYLPMALEMAPWYNRYLNNGLLGVVRMAGLPLLLILAVIAALRPAGSKPDSLRDAFAVSTVGFFGAAIIQQKGFSYHFVAAWGYGLLTLVRAWQTRPSNLSWRPSRLILRLGFLLLLVVPAMGLGDAIRELADRDHPRYRSDPNYPSLLPLVRKEAAGDAIAVLSSNPSSAWPLTLDAGARWSSRYMSTWPLAALYDDQIWETPRIIRPRPYADRTGFERGFSDNVVADLVRHRPRLLIVLLPEPSGTGGASLRRIDYLEYFGSDPRFREFMDDYRKHLRLGPYGLWVRSGP